MPKLETAAPAPRVLHPEITSVLYLGDQALTVDAAKEHLGWEEADKAGPDTDPDLYALTKLHVRMTKNRRNRFLTPSHLLFLRQEILSRDPDGVRGWEFNGVPILVSKYGNVVDGQHRLIALILAALERENQPHWKDLWPTEPTIEVAVTYGVGEDDKVFRTYNTGKSSSLAEVLFRTDYVQGKTHDLRKQKAKVLDYAVKLLWDRTGAKKDAYTPRRTHGEALDFLGRHGGPQGRVVKAMNHVIVENKGKKPKKADEVEGGGDDKAKEKTTGKVAAYVPLGTATGLLYLMGCSGTEGLRNGNNQLVDYADAQPAPNEGVLDWGRWKKANEFWTELAGGAEALDVIGYVPRPAEGDAKDGTLGGFVFANEGGGSHAEKVGVLIKAFLAWNEGRKLTRRDLTLEYGSFAYTSDGLLESWTLEETPCLGGIDAAGAGEDEEVDEEDTAAVEEIERLKAEAVEAASAAATTAANRKQRKGTEGLTDAGRAALNGGATRLPGEVPPSVKVKVDAQGKPPAPRLKSTAKAEPNGSPVPGGRKQKRSDVERAQTEKARAADEALAAERVAAGLTKPPLPVGPAPTPRKKPATAAKK